jgi:hypothetical protein
MQRARNEEIRVEHPEVKKPSWRGKRNEQRERKERRMWGGEEIEGYTRTSTRQQTACHKTFSQSEFAANTQDETAKQRWKFTEMLVF